MSTKDHDFPPGLGGPATGALLAAGYVRLQQLTEVTEAELGRLHGMGPKGLRILRETLAVTGRSFAGTERDPVLETRDEQPYAAIGIEVTLRTWGEANALVAEVAGWLGRHGIAPAGPPFFRYHVLGGMDEKYELEVGFPVTGPVPPDERVRAGSMPAGRYATLVHHGHPDQQGHSHAALDKWAAGQGLEWQTSRRDGREVWGCRFESYLTDPAEQPDPARWSIRISYQVRTR
ncbi:GyrI-like domain-containing protein [Amycolatopsis nigrescens]|uniref:GyrI-like domain-containing protein n=1 Tax=Amycolatopsis nigrescens TaxID=381445 RepID=UPI0003693A22|nr:GyrI-like domain-containing protein [Amycolatopsis nigrescens]